MKAFSLFLSLSFFVTLPCLGADQVAKLYKPIEIPVEVSESQLTYEDAQKIIPIDFQPGVGSQEVVSRIADRGLQFWYENSELKKSSIGQAVETAQETLATNIEVPAEKESGISHKFSIRFEAFQGLAKIEYQGWLNALVNCDAFRAQSEILFNEKIFNDKNLFVNHKVNSFESLSSVGLSWAW